MYLLEMGIYATYGLHVVYGIYSKNKHIAWQAWKHEHLKHESMGIQNVQILVKRGYTGMCLHGQNHKWIRNMHKDTLNSIACVYMASMNNKDDIVDRWNAWLVKLHAYDISVA
jgi:hypothetical protein